MNSHVHIEGEKIVAALSPRANDADIGPSVTGLDLRQFGHSARVWLVLTLNGSPTRCCPDNLGDGKVRIHAGNQPQGAELRNGCSRHGGDWR